MYFLRDTFEYYYRYGVLLYAPDVTVMEAIYDLYTKDLFDDLDEKKVVIKQHRFWSTNTLEDPVFLITEFKYDFGLKINHSYLSFYSAYYSQDLFLIKNPDLGNKDGFSLSDILVEDVCSLGDFGAFIIKNIDKFNGDRWTLFNSICGDLPAIGIRRQRL